MIIGMISGKIDRWKVLERDELSLIITLSEGNKHNFRWG